MPIIQSKTYPAPRPTRLTLFLRTFTPWQLWRFVVINFRMTLMILKSHGGRIEAREPPLKG